MADDNGPETERNIRSDEPTFAIETSERPSDWDAIRETMRKVLGPIASLKLTVALFAMAIFIILAGTFAQIESDIWDVIDKYFRTRFAFIPIRIFFPKSFFPDDNLLAGFRDTTFGFWFPGGWLIGAAMFVNLMAAHLVRFKIQAKGTRLAAGLGVIAAGCVTTCLVIQSGSNSDGFQEAAISWSVLWELMKYGLGALWLGMGTALLRIEHKRKTEFWLLAAVVAAIGAVLVWLFYEGDAAQFENSTMRILWQLIKGTFAGLVLLCGCIMAFKKRAGVVLLHAGVALMMLSELLVGLTAIETQMPIQEGETANFVRDIRTFELAVIDRNDGDLPNEDRIVSVPQSKLLKEDGENYQQIQDDQLPFDVTVLKYLKNSVLRKLKENEDNLATAGAGLQDTVDETKIGTGVDADSSVDIASAFVCFNEKGSDKEIGTYLLSVYLKDQQITIGDKTYDIALRFKRTYKPYFVHLIDVKKEDYVGTTTPRDYSSQVRLFDPTRNVDRKIRIWMNNPLRFAGETFYQSSYHRDPRTGIETTTLQVVTNAGWMIPYVSCMIVVVGLIAHFWIVLLRFLNRRASGQISSTADLKEDAALRNVSPGDPASLIFVALVVLVCGAWMIGKARVPRASDDSMNLYEFGKIPVVYQGRVKPLDTLARNSLRIISGKQTALDDDDDKQPAIRWFMDTIAKPQESFKYRVFRIENLELLDMLDLPRRKGFLYSIEDFGEKLNVLTKQAEMARKVDVEKLTVPQRKVLELEKKIGVLDLIVQSFSPPRIRRETAREDLSRAVMGLRVLENREPPLVIPPVANADPEDQLLTNGKWATYSMAWTSDLMQQFMEKEGNPAVDSFSNMIVAYADKDVRTFNREVSKYRESLAENPPEMLAGNDKTSFEAFFNNFEPFYYSAWLYVAGFLLATLAWLGWSHGFNRASFWLIAFTFLVHVFALSARVYISGRPPVTNLYSSAVFIGAACVFFGLIIEFLYRLGIGNILAAVSGFVTILIGHYLSGDGDTFTVLQAVLDTQVWLATHVVCITLGYAATFFAGLLGLMYIIRGTLTPSLTKSVGKDLTRMTYGTLCFAIFFSFFGTVLGGLWADDSWGRFWGWDPKENGALIIVLWNALVLHARWGGMVKDRGLAVLVIGGNIVTAWSWFGVNELGVGLHSYGFTDGVLLALGCFVFSQLIVMGLGVMPKDWWFSNHRLNA